MTKLRQEMLIFCCATCTGHTAKWTYGFVEPLLVQPMASKHWMDLLQ